MHKNEWTLVIFTLAIQAAAGLLLVVFCVDSSALFLGMTQPLGVTSFSILIVVILSVFGLSVVSFHMSNPKNGWKALFNIKSSWLSREIVVISAFTGLISVLALAVFVARVSPETIIIASGIMSLIGFLSVLVMSKVYMLRTLPLWNRWTTPAEFISSSILLGLILYTFILIKHMSSIGGVFENNFLPVLGFLINCCIAVKLIIYQSMLLDEKVTSKKVYSVHFSIRSILLLTGIVFLFAAFLHGSLGLLLAVLSIIFISEIKGRLIFIESFRKVGL